MNSNTTLRPVSAAVASIHAAYEKYERGFEEITSRAQSRFEQRDWSGAQADATERLTLNRAHVDAAVADIHDILEDGGKSYLNHYGKGTRGDGWYSFNAEGVHFIGLVNVVNLQGNGLGDLGTEQLEWLEKDVKNLSASTPIVVFAHVPLWIVYQDWG